MISYPIIKRIIDGSLSIIGLVITSPLFLIIALTIKIDSKGPVFFRQKRIGKNKKEFFIIKFRTMRTDTPKEIPTHMLQNPEIFITRTGKYLRKYSLDELPQIINIFKGEMSLIGPRPALWNQYDLIAERDKYSVNNTLPGVTGWAQINGRDELPIHIKAELDGYYTKNICIGLDFKIFVFTLMTVITAKGIVEGARKTSNEKTSPTNVN